jgi:hypothetical protein
MGLWPLVAAVLLTGCVAPLGPGFRVRSRQIHLSEISVPPIHVHVHLTDRMVNAGFRALDHLDFQFPSGRSFGTTHLMVRVNGQEVNVEPVSRQPGAAWRVPFEPPWAKQTARTIAFDYDLEPQANDRDAVGAAESGFYVAAPDALPQWLAPPGAFSVADVSGRKEQMEITAPSDFRVLAGGRESRRTRRGAVTVFRYRVSDAAGPAYLIAGRYLQQTVKTENGEVIFWTLTPFDARTAQVVANRLGATFATYRTIFGDAGDKSLPLRIVETSAMPAAAEGESPGDSGASFPYGVLLDRGAFARISSEPVLQLAEYELAHTWLSWWSRIRPDSEVLLSRGLGMFAVVLAAETREGQAARRAGVGRLLAHYDRARAHEGGGPLIAPPAAFTAGQRAVAAYKAALFCAALEDLAGRNPFDKAMRLLLEPMKGRQISYEELRASLEFATGGNLAGVFRTWLNRPGIPDAFRARYAPARVVSRNPG